ncbi:MAG: AbrB/MazE/SpoVT family DNA-binding domain-containing protein [Planctomycetia bacterium]|nr:AbrB/MazE/SpoVT family DNA-binding domain-containing protein [Planctomycetia bacterium]
MIKKLSKVGNSLALIIAKPILRLLDIDADTPLKITTDGDSIHIHPIRKKKATKR